MNRQPALFISHGSPMLIIEDCPAHRFLSTFLEKFGKPRAILVLSAHFEASIATVTTSDAPETIHDFNGFPQALYELAYPAPGDPDLALEVCALLGAGGLQTNKSFLRGLDHGAWVPLSLMYPNADIPVVQLSINPSLGPTYHYNLGKLLQPLRDKGVLIIGSGSATHNLSHALCAKLDESVPNWVTEFQDWLADAVADNRSDDIAQYRKIAPSAIRNHPTEEHLLPLLCVMGASVADELRRRIHSSVTYGALAMDAYLFGQ